MLFKPKFTPIDGMDTISFRRHKIWKDVRPDIKNYFLLNLFKASIKLF